MIKKGGKVAGSLLVKLLNTIMNMLILMPGMDIYILSSYSLIGTFSLRVYKRLFG